MTTLSVTTQSENNSPDLQSLLSSQNEPVWRELHAGRPLSPAIRYRWQGAMRVLCELYGATEVQQAILRQWRENFGDPDAELINQLSAFELPPWADTAPVYPAAASEAD